MLRRTKKNVVARCASGCLGLALVAGLVACDEPQVTAPASLEAPVKMKLANGEACLVPVVSEDGTITTAPMPGCEEENSRGFGLVVNARSNRVAVAALGQSLPRIVNLDSRRPGVTGIEVGRNPVDIAVTGGGTAAVVANQTDSTLMGIDLWTFQTLSDLVDIEGTLQAVEGLSDDEEGEARVAVLTSAPNRLDIRGGVRCERPADTVDRRDHDPDATCQWSEMESQSVELPARPVHMDVDAAAGRAWVIYRDLNALSWIALDDDALHEDETCIDGASTPPCEVDRLSWEEVGEDEDQPTQWGATQVRYDPLGLFVYVLDRPNNQLLVFDRQRRQLINASLSTEPPLAPFSNSPGIPLSRSATAMSASVQRNMVEETDGVRLMRYRVGARVAADSGRLYQVGVVDIDCALEDGEEPLAWEDFVLDAAQRAERVESQCIVTPAFSLGGDPDFDLDEDLLEQRIIEQDDALVAVTPVFALRDGEAREGRLVGRAQCTQPEELVDALRNITTEGSLRGCGSALIPQPVAPDVDEDLSSFSDVPRAALMMFAQTFFELDGAAGLGDVQPVIERSVYDYRLVNEAWNITYEGALPGIAAADRGLIDRDTAGLFLSGGSDFCAAGVEVGDRLRILSSPADKSECEVFEGEPQRRTFEVVEVGAFDVQLGFVDKEGVVDQFPTRNCFDTGLQYEIRASDEWIVAGAQSGMASPFEREGNSCVLREGAETGRLNGRVSTGEEFVGPYLNFRIHEGEVDAVQGLEYIFQVERNFSLQSELIVPNRREGIQSTMPTQVLFTPDLGFGRLLLVADSGADRLYLRNMITGDTRFIR